MKNAQNKVIMVAPAPPPWGGTAALTKDTLASRANEKYDFIFFSRGGRINYSTKLNFYLSELKLLIRFFLLTSKIKDRCIVHVNSSSWAGFWRNSVYAHISIFTGHKLVFHYHGGELPDFYATSSFIGKSIIRKTLQNSDLLIVLSNEWKDFCSKFRSQEEIFILYPSIDINPYLSHPGTDNKSNNTINFVFLGHFIERKGVRELLEVFGKLFSQKNANYKINFVGYQGNLLNEVESFCDKHSDSAIIYKKISHEKKIDILCNSDVLLLPTYAEGVPLVIMEAMAAGLAIITTKVGGIPTTLKQYENCLFTVPGDTDNLLSRILEISENHELRNDMMQRNRLLVKKKYSMDVYSKYLIEAYKRLEV